MMTYDEAHYTATPPDGRIKGRLSDDPGSYRIRFLGSGGQQIADWTSVTVGQNGHGPVDAPITHCPGPRDDVTAEWTDAGGANLRQDGPERINLKC